MTRIIKEYRNLRVFSIIFMILAAACLIFALMQPRWGIIEQKIKTDNYMVTIALDLSNQWMLMMYGLQD